MGAIVTGRIPRTDPDRWDAILAGKTRSSTDGWPVTRLYLDHHPELSDEVATWIEDQARARFPIDEAQLVHRVGPIPVGERIVVCACSGHPFRACREANRWMLEATKTHLPVWKREEGPRGERWVQGRQLQLPETNDEDRRCQHA